MRVFWISFLLVGSITCGPAVKGYGSNRADAPFMRQPFSSGYSFGGRGLSSGLGRSFPLPSLYKPSSNKAPELPAQDVISSAAPGSYIGTDVSGGTDFNTGYASFTDDHDYSPEVSDYEVTASQPDGSYIGGYGDSDSAYGEDGSYGFVLSPGDENSGSATSYDVSDENPEPVFSDVSDLEPVYSFSSRSRYQRGRAVFAQTRYIPGEPAPPVMPVSRRVHKTTLKQSSPPKAPAKGGF